MWVALCCPAPRPENYKRKVLLSPPTEGRIGLTAYFLQWLADWFTLSVCHSPTFLTWIQGQEISYGGRDGCKIRHQLFLHLLLTPNFCPSLQQVILIGHLVEVLISEGLILKHLSYVKEVNWLLNPPLNKIRGCSDMSVTLAFVVMEIMIHLWLMSFFTSKLHSIFFLLINS